MCMRAKLPRSFCRSAQIHEEHSAIFGGGLMTKLNHWGYIENAIPKRRKKTDPIDDNMAIRIFKRKGFESSSLTAERENCHASTVQNIWNRKPPYADLLDRVFPDDIGDIEAWRI